MLTKTGKMLSRSHKICVLLSPRSIPTQRSCPPDASCVPFRTSLEFRPIGILSHPDRTRFKEAGRFGFTANFGSLRVRTARADDPVGDGADHRTDDRSGPEMPQLPERCPADKQRRPRAPGGIDRQVGHRNADQVDQRQPKPNRDRCEAGRCRLVGRAENDEQEEGHEDDTARDVDSPLPSAYSLIPSAGSHTTGFQVDLWLGWKNDATGLRQGAAYMRHDGTLTQIIPDTAEILIHAVLTNRNAPYFWRRSSLCTHDLGRINNVNGQADWISSRPVTTSGRFRKAETQDVLFLSLIRLDQRKGRI